MFGFLSVKFLMLSFIGALLSAVSTSLMSVFISLKKISYMSEALSHISFAGIAIAILLGMSVNAVSALFVLSLVIIIAFISLYYHLEESNVTMIIMSVSMALGIMLLSLKKDYTADVSSYMFGNILLINQEDLYWLSVLIVLNLGFLMAFYREIIYMTYHSQIAEFYHIPAKTVYVIFLIILALNIVISVKIAGIVLITAQLILPGMISLNLTRQISKAIVIGVIASVLSSLTGFLLSYQFNFPSGSVIVLVLFLFFLISLAVKSIAVRDH
ncbi:MAG TPA: metal ABC transporter permease [Candidatus Cloacimonadota bacterium]|nr:metal ABC transporter permease [Candidatus Cloacimonadota bacterium]